MTKEAIRKARSALTQVALQSGMSNHKDIAKLGRLVARTISKDTVAGVKASNTMGW